MLPGDLADGPEQEAPPGEPIGAILLELGRDPECRASFERI